MKLEFIEARDLPDAWFQCVYRILECGRDYVIDRGSYEGQKRLEFDYITVHIKYPGVRPLLPDIPPSLGIPNPVEEGYLEEYLPYLMTSVKQPGEDYTYGEYLEHQIAEVIRMYKEDQGWETPFHSLFSFVGPLEWLSSQPGRNSAPQGIYGIKYWRGGWGNHSRQQGLASLRLRVGMWELAKLRTMCSNPSALSSQCDENANIHKDNED